MPYVVGLTGGIGSGKSTVAAMLAEHGARVVDADAITHELQQPGTEVFEEMVEAFGEGILTSEGTIDRARVGEIVFADPAQRRRLEAIVWPRVGRRIAELVAGADDDVVVLDVPLLAEASGASRRLARRIVVVDATPATQLAHLRAKGIPEEVARARMAAQAGREERLRMADDVLDNNGSLDELRRQVDDLWARIRADMP